MNQHGDDYQDAYHYTINHYRHQHPARPEPAPAHRHQHRWLTLLGVVIIILLAANMLLFARGNPAASPPAPAPITLMVAQPAGNPAPPPAETATAFPTLAAEEQALTRLYAASYPAVVKVFISTQGALDPAALERRADGSGSGFFIDDQGRLLTNQHVVNGAEDVLVQLADGQTLAARIVGEDLATDLAVLQVDSPPAGLVPVTFADSDTLNVGQVVVAIGHPFGLDSSLTVGHISGLGRMSMSSDLYVPVMDGLIQTDAAINPGNSGGALFDLQGHVVGITTAIISTSRGSQGIGLAVSSNTARAVIADLVTQGYVSRPFLGAVGVPLDRDLAQYLDLEVESGLLLQQVAPRSPADSAGLNSGNEVIRLGRFRLRVGGDILTAIDGRPVESLETYTQLIQDRAIGETVTLTIVRDGRVQELPVTLSDAPQR